MPDATLRLEWRSPQELAENPRNWRRHEQDQMSALSDAIGEVGWAGACLFNEATGRLIDGHARRKVAIEQGCERVPVLVGSWTEEQERKILATLDPLSAMAAADATALHDLLTSVGSDSPALAKMFDDLKSQFPLPTADTDDPSGGGDGFDAEPEEGPTRTSLGQLWLIGGKHRLLVGDCTSPENVDRLTGGETPFIMVTDPPYGVDYDPNWRTDLADEGLLSFADRREGKVANDHRCDWADAYRLFGGDVAYVWHASVHIQTFHKSLTESGLSIRSLIVWRKPSFAISRGHYHWQHEPCWYAYREGSSARWCGGRAQGTVWDINNKVNAEDRNSHGTQKPLECMARPIRNHGAPGDAVYDPFLGSGTTLIAAHRLNRTCYGCELDPKYADVILKRAESEGLSTELIENDP
jgi:DNA modification methylase